MNSIFKIARHEFSLISLNPVAIVFIAIVLVFAVINTLGVASIPAGGSYSNYTHDQIFYINLGNFYWDISVFFAFLAMSIGIVSVTDDRSGGSLRVLFTKPIYRRDVILGKFIGVGSFLLFLIVIAYTLYASLMIAVSGCPESIVDLVLRLGSFVILLFLNSCITLGLVMALGIFLSEAGALIASLAFISYEWLRLDGTVTSMGWLIGDASIIDPFYLYWKAFRPSTVYSPTGGYMNLYTITQPYMAWLQQAFPYILLMIADVIIIVLIGCLLFSREEA
jgi:ABC-2 type transport system permease protein